jgi:hypothetical protein
VQTSALPRGPVEEYIRLHAQASVIEKRMDELKKELLPALVDGAVSPEDLPYLLINRPQTRTQSDWKGYARTLLLKLYKRRKDPEFLADADIAAAHCNFPAKTIAALHVVENPTFAQELTSSAS